MSGVSKTKNKYLPTLDYEVKKILRAKNLPITLFSEDPYDRRQRLAAVLTTSDLKSEAIYGNRVIGNKESYIFHGENKTYLVTKSVHQTNRLFKDVIVTTTPPKGEVFYTEGPLILREIRKKILYSSLAEAQKRIQLIQRLQQSVSLNNFNHYIESKVNNVFSNKNFSQIVTKTAASRVITNLLFLNEDFNNSQYVLLVASADNQLLAWDTNTTQVLASFTGFKERISSLTNMRNGMIAGAGFENSVFLWNFNQPSTQSYDKNNILNIEHAAKLEGHENRISNLAFHPHVDLLVSSSHDETVQLWDLESLQSIATQETHGRGVTCLDFHPDGSLLSSGDLGGVVRLTDMRTGNLAYSLLFHADAITSLSFHPKFGNILASASVDKYIKLTDLRKTDVAYKTIPAHDSIISKIKYSSGSSDNY